MRYRAEIDGLRAIAVVPVMLFHAGFNRFSGGYVGVDVFFVISGYLITTIILSEKDQGVFSLVRFYERRARRILPALFLVMSVSLLLAWFWLLPSDMKRFSKSLAAVSTFASNILFLSETGYWDTANGLKPLLHTWSLAVEEQYYLLFPLFLMLMWRFGKRRIFAVLALIAVISLAVAQWWATINPTANFYLLPTRAWELALGACIAFYLLNGDREPLVRPPFRPNPLHEFLGFAGLAMIVYAVFAFDESLAYPGFYTLIPTVGTGLIILFSTSETLTGRLLGTRLLAGFGLISYSMYLWHQPLFAFARHRSLKGPDPLVLAGLTVLSVLLAYASWKYVEKPFRKKGRISRRVVFRFAASGSLAFILIGLTGAITDGFGTRFMSNKFTFKSVKTKLKVNHGLSGTCDRSFTLSPACRTSDKPEILVWGDSCAMHLTPGIMASNPDAKIIQMTKTGCGPFFDAAVVTSKYPPALSMECLEFTANVRQWLRTNNTVKFVVMSSIFAAYLSKENKMLLRGGKISEAGVDVAAREFEKTLDELEEMGITPIVVSPPPRNGDDLGRCLARAEWFGRNLDECNFHVEDMTQACSDVFKFLNVIDKNHRVIRLDSLICSGPVCRTHLGPTYLYRDPYHLSIEGSKGLGRASNFYEMIINAK